MLQCVAMCGPMLRCSVLQCVAVCCSVLICTILQSAGGSGEVCVSPATRCVTLCCMVFQCLYSAEGSSEVRVLNCVENVGSPSEACCRVLQGDARCCLVLQGVVVCCSVLQCVAANVAACSPVLLSVCRDWGGGGGSKSLTPNVCMFVYTSTRCKTQAAFLESMNLKVLQHAATHSHSLQHTATHRQQNQRACILRWCSAATKPIRIGIPEFYSFFHFI